MKKRAYRVTEIKKIRLRELAESVVGQRVIVGFDAAKEKQVAAITVGSEVLKTVKWKHPQQTPQFIELLESLPARSVEVALEPTGTYGDAVRYQLLSRDLPVFRVSPKKVKDAREVYDGVPSSHDAKAAAIIAKLHLDGISERWPLKSDGERALVADLSLLYLFDGQLERGVNVLESRLARHWPELQRQLDLKSVSLLTLLSHFGGPGEVARRPDEAKQLLHAASKGSLKEKKVDAVVGSAAATLGVDQIAAEVEQLQILAEDTLRALRSSRAAKQRVEQRVSDMPEVMHMAAPVGRTTAAVIWTGVGAPESFPHAKAYEKGSGLNVKICSSGQHIGQLKITKRGSSEVRRYLYLAVLRLIQSDPVVAGWYDRKVARDGGKVRKKAIVALMRKLIRALWHVAQGKPFDSMLLFDTRRLSEPIRS